MELPEPILHWSETLPAPAYVAVGGIAFFAFLVGWAIARFRARAAQKRQILTEGKCANPELRWRHEKLVLLERQDQEKQSRIISAIDEAFSDKETAHPEIRLRLFRISETLRDIRQRVGSDLSRLHLLQERISDLERANAPRPEALRASLEIATSHASRLEKVREQLRPITAHFLEIESDFAEHGMRESHRNPLRSALLSNRKRLENLSSDWQILTNEADRKISELLQGEPLFAPLRNILLIDGAVTPSLPANQETGPRQDIDVILSLLEENSPPTTRAENPLDQTETKPALSPQPDTGFRSPTNGNGSHRPQENQPPNSTTEKTPPREPLVVFRSNNPGLWGKDVYHGANSRACACHSAPEWAKWVSISRVDTGESVYAPTSVIGFSNHDLTFSTGFNASHELFYGARHLGMFSESVPNDVETRFTYGGWGFGHRVNESNEDTQSLQASGWAGKEISSDTVFEISFHQILPDSVKPDQILRPPKTALASELAF